MKRLDEIESKFLLKEIKIELTYKCNLSCAHCSSEGSLNMSDAISWAELKKILDSARRMRVERISLSGGEPFVWSEFGKLLSSDELNGFEVRIYTSGTTDNVREISSRINNKNLKFIFSVYATIDEIHDSITNVPGSLTKTLNSLRFIYSNFKTEVHFVPLSLNYHQLKPLIKMLREIGVDKLSVLRFVPQGRGAINKYLELNHRQNLELRSDITEIRNSGFNIRTGSPLNFLFLNDQPQCTSGIDKLIVAPDLSIYPCDAFKQISIQQIGIEDEYSSLVNHNLEECWINSKYIKEIRRAVKSEVNKKCFSCDKYELCKSGCIAQRVLNYNTLDSMWDPSCLKRFDK